MKIGITGPISSGKSIAARFLSNCLHFPLIDADKIGHKLINKPEIANLLLDKFGENILKNGKIDRKELGKLVFNNNRTLKTLNDIFRPYLRENIINELNRYNDEILEMAILHQYKLERYFDAIIFITAKTTLRIDRLKHKGFSKNNALKRILSQRISPESGDIMINNNFNNIADFKDYLKTICDLLN